jgi:hypothetical protein
LFVLFWFIWFVLVYLFWLLFMQTRDKVIVQTGRDGWHKLIARQTTNVQQTHKITDEDAPELEEDTHNRMFAMLQSQFRRADPVHKQVQFALADGSSSSASCEAIQATGVAQGAVPDADDDEAMMTVSSSSRLMSLIARAKPASKAKSHATAKAAISKAAAAKPAAKSSTGNNKRKSEDALPQPRVVKVLKAGGGKDSDADVHDADDKYLQSQTEKLRVFYVTLFAEISDVDAAFGDTLKSGLKDNF